MIEEYAWVTIVARALERLLIAGVGFAALYYGFGLFKIVSEQTGQLMAEKGDVKVHLSQVGPGVFFALFGSAVIAALVYQAPELNNRPIAPTTTYRGATPVDFPTGAENRRKVLASLNSLQLIASKATSSDVDTAIFQESEQGIDILRAGLIDVLLEQPGRFAEWQQLKTLQQNAPAQFAGKMKDVGTKTRFQEVDKLVTLTLNNVDDEDQP